MRLQVNITGGPDGLWHPHHPITNQTTQLARGTDDDSAGPLFGLNIELRPQEHKLNRTYAMGVTLPLEATTFSDRGATYARPDMHKCRPTVVHVYMSTHGHTHN